MSYHSESELYLRTITGTEIWCIGFDKPERFEGSVWHGGILDEFADMKATVWKENVRPALMDTKGWCWLIGVPAGRNHYYDLVEYARGSGDPSWADYNWFSEDVLDANEVDQLKSQYDERTYRQECCGSFESYEGRAYIYYNAEVHRKTQSFNSRVPVCIACDFNLDPCVWLIGQDVNGKISVQEEIKQRQTNIWAMCNTLKDRLHQRIGKDANKHLVIFYGDLEHGQARSVSATKSSWQIIKDEFKGWSAEYRLRGHPRIIDRINSVNSKLRTAKGEVQLGIDPACVELHKDFEIVSTDMLQNPTQKNTMPDRTHASDCIGYWIDYDYPVTPKVQTRVY